MDSVQSRSVPSLLLAGIVLAGSAIPARLRAADPPLARAAPGVVRVGPQTSARQIAGLAPTQVLEFPNGTRLTVERVRGLAPLAARLRAVTGRGVLRQRLDGPTLPVTPGTERRRLEAAPDATVLQLPDGRRMTAGQFKAVLPHLPAGRSASANVVKVAKGTPFSELLKRPDTDVLESPGGKRVTVGELRRLAQQVPPGIGR